MKKVLVIGGGPGGYVAAIRLAQLGAEVTLAEKDKLGGTCLNVGCIPTKCLLHSAETAEELKNRGAEMGVLADNVRIDFQQVMAHKQAIASQLNGGVAGLLKAAGVKVVSGEASFLDEKRVQIATAEKTLVEEPDAVIVSAGSYNAAPPIPGLKESKNCIDSTGALSLEALPETMAVIGAGVIGLELACAYAAFGTKVTVIEALNEALPMADREIIRVGINHLKKMGVVFYFGAKVEKIEDAEKGSLVHFQQKNGEKAVAKAEKVLVATGRRAATASLHLEAAKIPEERGAILVNEKMETGVKNIYAIGDCVKGYPQLAHVASAMGEVAAENAMGLSAAFDPKTTPSCLYIFPEAAWVGLTEEQCKAKEIPYTVGKFPLAANGKALIMNGGEGLVKVIVGKEYGEVLGMHMIGPRASDIIAEGALAIGTEATVEEVIATVHSHPTVTEAVREAFLASLGRAIHMPRR